MRNRRFVRQLELMLRNDTRPETVRRRAVRQPPVRPELAEKNLPSRPPIREDHVDEAPAAVHGGVPDVRFQEVQDTREVLHQVDAWQDDRAVNVRDDAPTGGRDDQCQGRLFEDVTEDVNPKGGSARPKRSPKPNPKYSPDDYDLSYLGDINQSINQSIYSI